MRSDGAPSSVQERPLHTWLVALLVCGGCALLVAGSVVLLRPLQREHLERERELRVLAMVAAVPGLEEVVGGLRMEDLEVRRVELESGASVPESDPGPFDVRRVAGDPARTQPLPAERDPAGIGRRPLHLPVYIVREGDALRLVVLPVYGSGYASTLWGYLALDGDLNTIQALTFYQHGETPGLGAEIETPAWQRQWTGKRVRSPDGSIRIRVAKGPVDPRSAEAAYEVDGISGATLTMRGVTNLVRFWLGPDGFGAFLERLREEEPS